ncbi:MAG: HAD-IIA family hydrolase [Lachnospiraceae bacterium]|nr:HAD-IIA family hydrolase [Lachnospiraceae bacterium]
MGGKLSDIDCFILDMDGTIYLGERWIDGALDFLQAVEAAGRQYVFLTNNSSRNAAVYVAKLARMGLSIARDRIITSGQATIDYLERHYRDQKVFLLGNELLQTEFTEAGIQLTDKDPEVVVVGFDTSLDYGKLCKVCDLVRSGLPYLSTHPDFNCPTETGFIPDAGAIHAFIHASADRYPDHIIGKPNRAIMDYLLERTKAVRSRTAMVGDRLYTDVAAGVNSGMTGILVLSGEAGWDDVERSEIKPHFIFDSVKEMIGEL